MTVLRTAQTDDLAPLAELLNEVFRRSHGIADQDVTTDFPLVFSESNLCNCRMILCDGGVVSHAALWPRELAVQGEKFKAGIIVLVATAPEFRHQGYAARLMQDLQRTMCEEEYDLGILWTGVPDFYRKLGWQVVKPRVWLATGIRTAMTRLPPESNSDVTVEPFQAQHHPGVIRLHDQEAIRVARSRSDYEVLMNLPKVDTLVATRDGEVAAYLVVSRACNKRGFIEYAGSQADLLALCKRAVAQFDLADDFPMVIFHPYEQELRSLESAGARVEPLPSSKGHGDEMVLPVDPRRVTEEVLSRLFVWGLDLA